MNSILLIGHLGAVNDAKAELERLKRIAAESARIAAEEE